MTATVSRHVPTRCDEIMKRSIRRVRPRDTLRRAAQIMREHDVGFLPVCTEGDRVVGVITDRDIVIRACALMLDLGETPVEQVMSRDVVTCRPSHALGHVEAMMREHQKFRIVVSDAKKKLLGVISLSDVVQYERPARSGATLAAVASRKYAR